MILFRVVLAILIISSGTIAYPAFSQSPDTTAPVVTVPDYIEQQTKGDTMIVEFTVTATDDIDGSITPICVPVSGFVFPMGTTTVTCTATDSEGNRSSKSFTVTVIGPDITPPVVIVPNDMVIQATSNDPVPTTFSASASDDVDGNITPVCSPISGSDFPIGKTTITCTATDTSGNTTRESFIITVTYEEAIPESESIESGLAPFVDTSKDPQSYVDRYNNQLSYKNWFDKNYPEYSSIYEA